MKTFIVALLVAFSSLWLIAQKPPHTDLQKQSVAQRPDPSVIRSREMAIDFDAIASGEEGSSLHLPLFADVDLTIEVVSASTDASGVKVLRGYARGLRSSRFLLSASNRSRSVIGYVELADGARYEVRRSGVSTRAVEVDMGKVPPSRCAADVPSPPSPEIATRAASRSGPETIDLLVVYDTTALSWANANGGIDVQVSQAVSKTNLALANSSIPLTINLLKTQAVSYSSTRNLTTDLAWVNASSEAATARNAVGADVVMLLVDTGVASGVTGIANAMKPGGSPNSPFCVTDVEVVAFAEIVPHELMHLLGAGHSTSQVQSPGPGVSPYAAGGYFAVAGTKYHSIMSYYDDGSGVLAKDCLCYSSPTVAFMGSPTGSATADNQRCILENMGIVAAYRQRVQAPAPPPAPQAPPSPPPVVIPTPIFQSSATASPSVCNIGDLVSFSSAASDHSALPLSYSWDFGDGTTASGASASHSYSVDGSFSATVTATDGQASSTSSAQVTVLPRPFPLAQFSGSIRGKGRDTCQIKGLLLKVSPYFDPTNEQVTIRIGGLATTFMFDIKGHAKNSQGQFVMSFKNFHGGDVPFSATVKGDMGQALGLSRTFSGDAAVDLLIQVAGRDRYAKVQLSVSKGKFWAK